MNTHTPPTAQDAASPRLPALSDERVDDIETAVFAGIARDRARAGSRRRGLWLGAGAAAVVIVVAAAVAPLVAGVVSPPTVGGSTADSAVAPAEPGMAGGSEIAKDDTAGGSAASAPTDLSSAPSATDVIDRQIIATASATIVVDDIAAGARSVAAAAAGMGGYVESMTVGQSGVVLPLNGAAYDVAPTNGSQLYPSSSDGGWVTVRVPSDQLMPLIDQLSNVGEVTASSLTRQDVTDQTIDLQARIDASQASVDRLTELMTQATSTADLIAAEAALADRQATLESYQQQLKYLSDQVDLSTLTVTLEPAAVPVDADPAGFADGIAAGWNGLVATLNAVVISIGFLIPWIVVVAVIAAVVWAIVTLARRGRKSRARTSAPASAPANDE